MGLMSGNRNGSPNSRTVAAPSALRRLLEVASRGVVLRRRLPARFGSKRVYVSPECGLRYWRFDLGKIDPTLLDLAEYLVRPGDVVWDVGANVGLFTFAAAYRAARVLAFEPDPWLAELLERTAAFFPNVSVIRAAVADYCGEGKLHIARRARGANFLLGQGSSQSGGTRRLAEVKVVTLDSLDQAPPNVLKIDVETGELAVLRGAARLLAQSLPTVICEVAKENVSAVTACLRGYTLFDAERGQPVNTAVWNTVAVPAAAVCPTLHGLATVES
ncbi:MAG: FkbM family methyltransferase [Terriglobales bacterium]